MIRYMAASCTVVAMPAQDALCLRNDAFRRWWRLTQEQQRLTDGLVWTFRDDHDHLFRCDQDIVDILFTYWIWQAFDPKKDPRLERLIGDRDEPGLDGIATPESAD